MPDNPAPGVYIEESSFKSRSIEGVSTSTAGFAGPVRFGPVDGVPQVITSLSEFERVYGKGRQLEFEGSEQANNYLWNATRAFFAEGGKRLYIGRAFRPLSSAAGSGTPNSQTTYQRPTESISESDSNKIGELYCDGHARAWVSFEQGSQSEPKSILIRARFPGAAGNMIVSIAVILQENLLAGESGRLTAAGLSDHDTVWISNAAAPDSESHGSFYRALFSDEEQTWLFGKEAKPDSADLRLNTPVSSGFKSLIRSDDDIHSQLRVATLTVSVASEDGGTYIWDRIAPDPNHTGTHGWDSLTRGFAQDLENPISSRVLPIVILAGDGIVTGVDVLQTILRDADGDVAKFDQLDWLKRDSLSVRRSVQLAGGNDGQVPDADAYLGRMSEKDELRTGLSSLELVDEISIVAAPGATADYANNSDTANAIIAGLVAHAERLRFRIAVIDCGDNQTISEVRATRALIDSKYAAFYYPWVRILDPITQTEINQPPSGFVAGIYARVDSERGVSKAPANEVVRGATGLEVMLSSAEQEILNPEGVNCFRFFPGRGFRLWGARLASSDPEFKYVNLRRYFAYLEHSIDKGTQWAVFEPNDESLWANVRRTVEDFLLLEWRSGALVGDKPERAYFVKCDRTTMTQKDLDNGLLVCLIGVAPTRPAEFVIFRIGQWTASRRDP